MNDIELKAFIRGIKFIGEYLLEHGHIGEHVKSKVDQCASHFSNQVSDIGTNQGGESSVRFIVTGIDYDEFNDMVIDNINKKL